MKPAGDFVFDRPCDKPPKMIEDNQSRIKFSGGEVTPEIRKNFVYTFPLLYYYVILAMVLFALQYFVVAMTSNGPPNLPKKWPNELKQKKSC